MCYSYTIFVSLNFIIMKWLSFYAVVFLLIGIFCFVSPRLFASAFTSSQLVYITLLAGLFFIYGSLEFMYDLYLGYRIHKSLKGKDSKSIQAYKQGLKARYLYVYYMMAPYKECTEDLHFYHRELSKLDKTAADYLQKVSECNKFIKAIEKVI